jgi:hypothetical protein
MNVFKQDSTKHAVQNGYSTSGTADAPVRDSRPTVIITGPPWPRSGTGRVMQSQIQFYRKRGYNTVFIAVPFRWNYTRNSPVWDEFRDGLNEMGADLTLLAAIEPRHFTLAKFSATLRYRRRGTALDWLVAIGRSTQLTSESLRLLKNLPVALFHVNHVFSLGFALRLKEKLTLREKDVPVILDTHDIQSQMLHEKQEPNPWTHRPDSLEPLLESEVAQLRSPDALIHLSVSDFSFFREELPEKAHFLALPTIDEGFVSSVKLAVPAAESIDLLFVAHWHPPNLTAIQWFFENVWPLIANRGYKFRIVGRIGILAEGQAPELFEKFRDCFVGEVVDLAPYYRSARCVIAPMISGSGISIKTIEAFALGKAFVGTSKAFRGMPMERLEELGIHAFDEPPSFADAIVATLSNAEEAERTSQAAYDALFSTEACFAVRDKSLNAALQHVKSTQAKAR